MCELLEIFETLNVSNVLNRSLEKFQMVHETECDRLCNCVMIIVNRSKDCNKIHKVRILKYEHTFQLARNFAVMLIIYRCCRIFHHLPTLSVWLIKIPFKIMLTKSLTKSLVNLPSCSNALLNSGKKTNPLLHCFLATFLLLY